MAFMGGNTAEWHKLVDGLSFADDATDANAFSGHFGLADMARAADAIDRVPAPPDPALADPIREAASAAWPAGNATAAAAMGGGAASTMSMGIGMGTGAGAGAGAAATHFETVMRSISRSEPKPRTR